MKFTTHLHTVLMLQISEAICLLPLQPSWHEQAKLYLLYLNSMDTYRQSKLYHGSDGFSHQPHCRGLDSTTGGGHSCTGTGFSPNNSVFPCQYYPTNAPYSYFIHLSLTLYNLSNQQRHLTLRHPLSALSNI
jgi:hypothetical protein